MTHNPTTTIMQQPSHKSNQGTSIANTTYRPDYRPDSDSTTHISSNQPRPTQPPHKPDNTAEAEKINKKIEGLVRLRDYFYRELEYSKKLVEEAFNSNNITSETIKTAEHANDSREHGIETQHKIGELNRKYYELTKKGSPFFSFKFFTPEIDINSLNERFNPNSLWHDNYQYAGLTYDKSNTITKIGGRNSVGYVTGYFEHGNNQTLGVNLPRGYAEYSGEIIGDRYQNGQHKLTAAYTGNINLRTYIESTHYETPFEVKFSVNDRSSKKPLVSYKSTNFDHITSRSEHRFAGLGNDGTWTFFMHSPKLAYEYEDGIDRNTELLVDFYGPTGEEMAGRISIANIEPGYDMYGGMMGKRIPSKPTTIRIAYKDLGDWGGITLNSVLKNDFRYENFLRKDYTNAVPAESLPKSGTADYHGASKMQTFTGVLPQGSYTSDFDMHVDFKQQTVNPRLSHFSANTGFFGGADHHDFGSIPIESLAVPNSGGNAAVFRANGSTINDNPTKIVGAFAGGITPTSEVQVKQVSGMFEVNDKNDTSRKLQGTFYGNKQ